MHFAEKIIGLGVETLIYLDEKNNKVEEQFEARPSRATYYLTMQVKHLAKLPYLTFALTVQTIADAGIVLALVGMNAITFGKDKNLRNRLSARLYNLFIADSLTWLSILPSISSYICYMQANAMHLGTTRNIDFADDEEFPTEETESLLDTPLTRREAAKVALRGNELNQLCDGDL